mgnify:CR=1 FL=1
MIKIVKLKDGTVFAGNNNLVFGRWILDAIKEKHVSIDQQWIVTKDEVDYKLEKVRLYK